ncbi:MAG: alpha-2-macroglobulin family protein [Bernardetiaceae bacterium]|nr:alpha-2-macroglobulin family protein [Bernardetiaceae bacterium]
MFAASRITTLSFLLLLLLYACTQKAYIEVVERNFEEEIALKQNLNFKFNQPLADESLIGKWIDDAGIDITPKVAGKFKWITSDELVFSPEQSFMPMTAYEAKINDKILSRASKDLKIDKSKIITFRTPDLLLTAAETFWGISPSGMPELQMNLHFNYEVDPKHIAQYAEVIANGQSLAYKVNSNEIERTIRISVENPNISEATSDIQVKIREGLGSPVGNSKAKKMEYESEIPSRDVFEILDIVHNTTEGYLQVSTNHFVDNSVQEIEKLIRFNPTIAFNVEKLDFGFAIKANFETGKNYQMRIGKNLKSIFAKNLAGDYDHYIVMGNVQPAVNFTDKKAVYLTSKGEKNIAIHINGMDKVRLQLFKIYSNNIQHFLRETVGNSNYSSIYSYSYQNYEEYGDLLHEELYPLNRMAKSGAAYAINMKDLMQYDDKSFEGIYLLRALSDDDRWVSDAAIISVSDMGFIVKQTDEEVLVFVNTIESAKPIADAKVKLISGNNQEILETKTDQAGIAHFKNIDKQAPGFNISMLTAERNGEFSYMYFNHNPVNISDFSTEGKREKAGGLQAFLYGERTLYRPGETLNFKAIVRNAQWKPIGRVPMQLHLILPNGKPIFSRKATLNDQGTIEDDFTLSEAAVTGAYTLQIKTATGVLLNTMNINVEEFVPNRIKVINQVDKDTYKEGDKVFFGAQALNLFGPPAADRNYEVEMMLSYKNFSPQAKNKTFKTYNFDIERGSDAPRYFENVFKEGKTSAEGRIKESFEIPKEYKNTGLLQGNIYATVFDETGRPVSKSSSFDVATQPVFIGIQSPESYWVSTNQPVKMPLVALSPDGTLKNSEVRLELVRLEWQTVLESNYGNYAYVSRKKENLEESKTINVNGTNTSYTFVPKISGEYEVRAYLPNANAYVVSKIYAYGWGSSSASSFAVNKEGKIDIQPDKDKYSVGETAKLLFKTPFAGRMLVTLERNRIFKHFYVDVKDKSASVSLDIPADYLPNVYVSATLIKPIASQKIPLTVACGFASLAVEDSKHQLALEITAPEKSRSKRKQVIKAKTSPKAEVTIAVVDEGILLIKNIQTPDPYGYFFQKRALEVNSFNIYPRLFPEFKAHKPRYGADGYDLGNRANPLTNKRIKPAAFWSKTLIADAQGNVSYELDIPEFSGDLRIMAVAVKDDAFASADKNMKVADPLVLSTGLPRFLSPNDRSSVPLTLSNTTEKEMQVQVSMRIEGSMKAEGTTTQSISIPAQAEKTVTFQAQAAEEIGLAKVILSAKAGGETFTQEIDMSVRPAASLLKNSASAAIKGGESKTLSLETSDFIPASRSAKLVVSRSPMVEFAGNLSFLINYPYGCVEQTISSVFPQLYVKDLSQAMGQMLLSSNDPDDNIRQAIRKLQSMQLPSGGLSYWQGGHQESHWGSTYAAHFLIEAQKAGFEVDKQFMERLYDYMAKQVKKKDTERLYFENVNDGMASREIASKTNFYTLYVLAMAGQQDVPTMNYYKSRIQNLALDSRYLLATSYKLLGDAKSYQSLLPTEFAGERARRELGGSFYSYIRDQAISLNMLIEVDPDNKQVPILARQLSQELRQASYLNTQEAAFALLALGKLSRKEAQKSIKGKILADGKLIANYDGTARPIVLGSADLLDKKITIETEGEGTLYYFWESQGISRSGKIKEEDANMKVRRTFYDRKGNLINGRAFSQNELIVVKISVVSTSLSTIENVVITDMLPAGLEAENPRLGGRGISGFEWIKESDLPSHYDFRDDRVNIFTDVRRDKTLNFYYTLRAVSKGEFALGPVGADAMYDAAYRSYYGSGKVRVE